MFTAAHGGYVAEKAESESGWLFPVGDKVHELGYTNMFTDMFAAMEGGKAPMESFYDGYVINAILDACFESTSTRKWEPDRDRQLARRCAQHHASPCDRRWSTAWPSSRKSAHAREQAQADPLRPEDRQDRRSTSSTSSSVTCLARPPSSRLPRTKWAEPRMGFSPLSCATQAAAAFARSSTMCAHV